ncbi:MAG: DNA polymerase IV, partial [Candidatus Omnitrophica bacterium]|nr:DNA polymerase IV [Candidatus Omnitrophota bacterium]
PNMMTAKIASDIGKPDGFVIVTEENLLKFLHPLPVKKLWGVGEKTAAELDKIGINTIGDLAKRTPGELELIFGKNGLHAWELANGIDPRKVELDETIRSISNEYTFDEDVIDEASILNAMMFLAEKVSYRLRKASLKGKTVTLKIRFEDFKTYTRAETLNTYTNFVNDIYRSALSKLSEFNIRSRPVRLIGVRVSSLVDAKEQTDLFETSSEQFQKKERIHSALDRLKDKFGDNVIRRRK